MTDLGWIEIPNWDRFQHYRDRDPPWIKFYTELLHDPDYLALSGDQRAILHGLWLEYASSRRRLRAETRSLSSRLLLRVTKRQLETLNHAGFITILASKPLASRYQDASATRARGETEREEPKPEGSTVTEDSTAGRPLDQAPTLNGDGGKTITPDDINYQPKEIPS